MKQNISIQMIRFAVLFCLLGAVAAKESHSNDPCASVDCRAGRECQVRNGEGLCECIKTCPDHFSPVCGSNGRSYDSYCLLHQAACVEEVHIRVEHKGYCIKHAAHKDKKHHKNKERPIVCFQWQRDALHGQISSQLHHGKDIPKLWTRFSKCDGNKDSLLDANEFLECVKNNITLPIPSNADSELVQALCIDAIIDAGDSNSDWRLSFQEFKNTMEESFKPPNKTCSLEGKHFSDGAETKVDCNECVCACGNWVCTSTACEDEDFDDDLDDDDFFNDDDDDENELDDEEKEKQKILIKEKAMKEEKLKRKHNLLKTLHHVQH